MSVVENGEIELAKAIRVRIEHLGDPQLSPQTIAAAHHISARTLHRLFGTHDSTGA